MSFWGVINIWFSSDKRRTKSETNWKKNWKKQFHQKKLWGIISDADVSSSRYIQLKCEREKKKLNFFSTKIWDLIEREMLGGKAEIAEWLFCLNNEDSSIQNKLGECNSIINGCNTLMKRGIR